MTHVTLDQAVHIAQQHQLAGRVADAEAIYRQVLSQQRDVAAAWYGLGTILLQRGHGDCLACLRNAIAVNPYFPEAHNSLGAALGMHGRGEEAIASFHTALALRPDYAEANLNLSNAYGAARQWPQSAACASRAIELRPDYPEAIAALARARRAMGFPLEAIDLNRRAIALRPDFPEAWVNLGNVLQVVGQIDQALDCYRQAIGLRPQFADAHCNMAIALIARGDFNEAIAQCKTALSIRPDSVEARNTLADASRCAGQMTDAIGWYRQVLAARPNYPEALNNLGNALLLNNEHDPAIESYRKAISVRPDYAEAFNNLGRALADVGDRAGAVAAFERSIEIQPTSSVARSNLIYTLLLQPQPSQDVVFTQLREWNRIHAAPLAPLIMPHDNDRDPDRRLRIGYLSPDLRDHVVGRNVLPIFSRHDKTNIELFFYSQTFKPDTMTDQFKAIADGWRPIAAVSDERVQEMIRNDRIDVLIELALHMDNNRLLVMARKPAPVQVTWAGYPGSTGLDAIDYRLTDPYLDPPGLNDAFYSEKSWPLPDSFWCYDPLDVDLPVNELPALTNGYVTFGCVNNFCKVNPETLERWAQVMHRVPGSRLLLMSAVGSGQKWMADVLQAQGIGADRVDFVPRQPRRQYTELFHRIDLALDTYPYTGHTTGLDGLWMGVPSVSLYGQPAVSRGGFSQLSNLGMAELATDSPERFVEIAVGLASDPARLAELRRTLRSRMKASPLTDAARFAANLESAYRRMFSVWCASR